MITRLVTRIRNRRQPLRDDSGMTLSELLIASTLMIVLLTVVMITMTLFNNVATSVSSQYQELDQALPALAPLQSLIRAEVEPGPTSAGVPVPGFGDFNSSSATINNYSLTFYSNIGTAYNNVTTSTVTTGSASSAATAGPAKIIAAAYTSGGVQATSSTSCTMSSPCTFQVREYLPVTTNGVSSCPGVGTGPTCTYLNYTLITDAQHVVNNTPIFSYNIFDPNLNSGTAYTLTTSEVQNNSIILGNHGYTSGPATHPLSGTNSCVAQGTTYQTAAQACPADNIQSVGIDLEIGVKGSSLTPTSGTTTNYQNTVDNQIIAYRYPESSGSTTYPYQYSAGVG